MRTFSAKERLGACILDGPRFLRAGVAREDWPNLRNRADRIEPNPAGAGVRCDWEFTRSLHFCDVYPAAGGWLLRRALQTAPIRLQAAPDQVGPDQVCWNGAETKAPAAIPDVSFLIGHRGRERLPHLLTTLESIAAQTGVTFECVVVEQDTVSRVRTALPSWVKWTHTPAPPTETPLPAPTATALPAPETLTIFQTAMEKDAQRYQFALDHGARFVTAPDARAFYIIWYPPGASAAEPPPMIATIHGHGSYAFDEFFLWQPYAQERGYGIIALQWWFGTGEKMGDLAPFDARDFVDALLG